MTNLRVGFISDFEGSSSPIGIETYNAMQTYLERTSEHNITVIPISVSSNEGLLPAYRSVREQGIRIVILGLPSVGLMRLKPTIESDNVLAFNIFSSSSELSGQDDNIIRNVPDTGLESSQIADFIGNRFPDKRLLIVCDSINSNYSLLALQLLTNRLREAYPDVKYRCVVLPFDRPNREQITAIGRAGDYDLVYLLAGGYMAFQAGSIAQSIRLMRPDVPLLISPWLNTDTFFKSSGNGVEGAYIPSLLPYAEPSPAYSNFISLNIERSGNPPQSIYSFFGYEAIALIQKAYKAGMTSPSKMKKYLLSSGPFDFIIGEFQFDSFGDVNRHYFFYRYKDGSYLNE